jgi:hypothetical protein
LLYFFKKSFTPPNFVFLGHCIDMTGVKWHGSKWPSDGVYQALEGLRGCSDR